jgi:hypothetical protein
MTDATDTPEVPKSIEPAAPVIEVAASDAAPAQNETPLFPFIKDWTFAPARLLLIGAAVLGLAGGAAATSAYYEMSDQTIIAAPDQVAALSETVRRLETSVAALSTTVSASAKLSNTQWAKIGERFDKVEKSIAEPGSRLAALTDAVEKLRLAAAAPAIKAAATDVTGSVAARAPAEPPKPVLASWTLHEVDRGVATVEGRQGIFDVAVGDPLPGLDRVEAIRRQDGRWVVVTRKGIIVAR